MVATQLLSLQNYVNTTQHNYSTTVAGTIGYHKRLIVFGARQVVNYGPRFPPQRESAAPIFPLPLSKEIGANLKPIMAIPWANNGERE
jgi:hypothetical protein